MGGVLLTSSSSSEDSESEELELGAGFPFFVEVLIAPFLAGCFFEGTEAFAAGF